jgi:hypothetical protein
MLATVMARKSATSASVAARDIADEVAIMISASLGSTGSGPSAVTISASMGSSQTLLSTAAMSITRWTPPDPAAAPSRTGRPTLPERRAPPARSGRGFATSERGVRPRVGSGSPGGRTRAG